MRHVRVKNHILCTDEGAILPLLTDAAGKWYFECINGKHMFDPADAEVLPRVRMTEEAQKLSPRDYPFREGTLISVEQNWATVLWDGTSVHRVYERKYLEVIE